VGRFAFGRKIWHTIFFGSKPNFSVSGKLAGPRSSSGFTNDVFSLFVSSQSKEDGLTKLLVAGPLGKLDLGNQNRLNPIAPLHD
jgi:hypothetical protein